MAYDGLESVFSSDLACDTMTAAAFALLKSIQKSCIRNLDVSHNTDGCVNTCLIIESGMLTWAGSEIFMLDFLGFFDGVKDGMVELIDCVAKGKPDDPEDDKARRYHLKAYRRMLKSLTKFIKRVENEG
jgi:hypothetical protein